MPLRLLMMGTGSFAVPTFRALLESRHNVVGLVTQPDRTGRGHHQHHNPMKQLALEHGLDLFQPEKVNRPDALARLREFQADLFVVAAYGQILSESLLSIPPHGAVNIHASILPKYRGAAPIQYAVLNGETETGVTIFQIQPQLDSGPILAVVKTPIGHDETSGELESRLSQLAAPLALKVVDEIEAGTTHPIPQDDSLACKAPKIPKSAGEIDWTKGSEQIGWHIRAMQPWPMPYTFLHVPGRPPQRLLVLGTAPVPPSQLTPAERDAAPGDVIVAGSDLFRVRTGDGAADVLTVQPAGKRAMPAADFLRGHNLPPGSRLGPQECSPRPS